MSTEKSENKRPFSGPKERSVCNTCGVTFGAKKSLYKHTRKFHPEESQPISNKLICGMCGEKFRLTVNLNEHLQNVHNVELKFAHENFYSEEDFLQWKEKIQVESVSSFKIRNTCEKEAGLKLTYYICHRSGVSNPTSIRIRHAKALGSVKCGFACPAMMIVSRRSIDGVTEITVQLSYSIQKASITAKGSYTIRQASQSV
ncbi:c2H2-type domain-containing protein [Nephila pilipes]|uniref:C2H2-type domain-containing protein n=1 Tax=Nephila pilipes TaxID=299642 RepID=A0A8X6QN66_NEPPI|nr:c2H2-type domain-containing protein [Nephila pilipes]